MNCLIKKHHVALWLLLAISMLLLGCSQKNEVSSLAPKVVEGIRENYESGLERLPLSLQRHYAQRIYRVTGDETFLPYQERHAVYLIESFDRDVAGVLTDPGYVLLRDQQIAERRALRTERQQQRAILFDRYPGMLFHTDLVFRLVQLDYYGLLNHLPAEQVAVLKARLQEADFKSFLFDEAAIRHYAAQAANQVWFLYQLGIIDLRQDFERRFQEVYPLSEDHLLSRSEFHNKIYGLTHIVIAASRYYQDQLPIEAFAWITDYFVDQLPVLLETTTEDILAEVGISLALTSQLDHPAVEQIRERLISAYDPDARMIPSPTGGTDFAQGEHRNVLAVMLLIWPDQLFQGPHLDLEAVMVKFNQSE